MTKYLKGYFIREDIKMENKHMKRCLPSLVIAAAARSLQSCLTLCDPIDSSTPGSAIPGILQARTLEWVAMPSSRGSSRHRDRTLVSQVSCTGRWPCGKPRKAIYRAACGGEGNVHYLDCAGGFIGVHIC